MKNSKTLHLLFVLLLTASLAKTQDYFTWDNATVYFLLTDRFHNGNPSNDNSYGRQHDPVGGFLGGDLQGLTQKINEGYFDDLGVDAIWLTAPYEQIHSYVPGYWNCYPCDKHYAYHGYYALDFTEVDANMGTVTDMQNFVDAAHNHGIRVIMDIVLNHFGYATEGDGAEFGFGPLSNPDDGAWCNWLTDSNGNRWVRAGETGTDYCSEACSGDDLGLCLGGLPDVRTELTTDVGLPKILENKWDSSKESQEMNELNNFFNNTGLGRTPANHIIKWLTDWVRDYGIDGFRIDTYKHVERHIWGELKLQAQDAFDDWKAANPSKVLDNNDFWMVGEWFGHGPGKNQEAVTVGRTDALINFNFKGVAGNLSNIESTFANYASIVSDPEWNILSYISSHDTDLFDRNNLYDAGTSLLLAPGAVQIYYGDETRRLHGNSGSDQDTRSYMNWNSIDNALLSHWQKIGQFRRSHPAVGAGTHTKLSDSPYIFAREFSNEVACDAIVVAIGASGNTTINVSSVFSDGTQLRDAYTGNTATVSGGNVSFTAGGQGIILVESLTAGDCPPKVFFETQAPNDPNDSYDPNNLSVAILASIPSNAPLTIHYTTDGSTPTTSSAVYSSPFNFGNPTDVTINAIACVTGTDNCSPIESKRYIVGDIPAYKVYFKRPAEWGSITPMIYHWEAEPLENLEDAMWPGVEMTHECDDWYSYTFNNILCTNVIFNNGTPNGSNQTNDLTACGDGYYDDPVAATGGYSMKTGTPDICGGALVACFSANPPAGTAPLAVSFNAGCSITPAETTISTYSWDFGDGNVGSGVNESHTYSSNGTYTATLTVTNSAGEMDTETTIINVGSTPTGGITVHFEKPAGWGSAVNIHYWDAVPANSVTSTTWPGETMTDEGNGWYSHTFPNEVTQINVIFNATGGQTADLTIDQTAWFPITCAIGNPLGGNGNWIFSDPTTTPAQTYDVFFENTDGWAQPKVYYWEADGMTATTWPGEDMTLVSGNTWKFTFTNNTNACVIFNDGSNQTANLSVAAPGASYNNATGFWTPNTPPALASELIAFNAISHQCAIELNWEVMQAKNIDRYEIQNSEDGIYFSTIDVIDPEQENGNWQKYTYTDKQPNGAFYYRLKMVEKDGSVSTSIVRYVPSDCVSDFKVYPNPFRNQITIDMHLPADMEVVLKIFTITGQEVATIAEEDFMEGSHRLTFNTNYLTEGIYLYQLRTSGQVLTKKLVK